MIAVTFALPEESRDFRKALRDATPAEGGMQGFLPGGGNDEEIRVVHTGVGLASAGAKLTELLAREHPRIVISSGYAGGLDPRLKISDLVVATNFSSESLAGFCRNCDAHRASIHFGALTSQAGAVESVADKAALAKTAGAIAVDMETDAIAAACGAAHIPLLSVRAISDSASEPLPVPFEHWFDLPRQRPRPLALVLYLARHPSKITPFARFVRGLSPARRASTEFLIRLLESKAFRDFANGLPCSTK